MTSTATTRGIIALDCDGVLLNYHETFAKIYEQAFSIKPVQVLPNAYHVSSVPVMIPIDEN